MKAGCSRRKMVIPWTLTTSYTVPGRECYTRQGYPLPRLETWRRQSAAKSGVPIPAVSSLLGHRDSSITLRVYAHLIEGMGGVAAQTMDDLLGD